MAIPVNLLPFLVLSDAIIGIVIIAIFAFIVINFFEAQPSNKVKEENKSIVETGSMVFFFVFFYLIIRLRIGVFELNNLWIRVPFVILGLITILLGAYFNIKGRMMLGKNWANQIKIYKNQTLVTKGVYSIVRHPLYASLIWMFYAASFIYFNWLAFLINSLIFVPFMSYRANQEERLLEKEFKNYKTYKKQVGMFFPRIKRW
jgi:protein-S-isoprenylcysteine O-methyltransferase Ste14